MVGDDTVGGLVVAFGLAARKLHGCVDQRLEQIDVVIVMNALKYGGDALKLEFADGQADATAGPAAPNKPKPRKGARPRNGTQGSLL